MVLHNAMTEAKKKLLTKFKDTLRTLRSVGNEDAFIQFLATQTSRLLPHLNHAIDLQIQGINDSEKKEPFFLEKTIIAELERTMKSYATHKIGPERNTCYEEILAKTESLLSVFGGELR